MLARRPAPQRPSGSLAAAYPSSGTSESPDEGDFFGGRVFDRDGDGSEDDFDFHRGKDMSGSIGDVAYAPAGGARIRWYQGHYYLKRDSQLDDWPLSSGTGGTLAIVTPGTGPARASGTGAHVWRLVYPRVATDDWVFDLAVPSGASWDATGKTIAGLRFAPLAAYHASSTEFVQIRYDGTTLYCDAENSAAGTKSTTFAVAGARWLRIEYVSGTVSWRTATDTHGTNFTSRDTFAATFTGFGSGASWALELLAEIQADASPATIDIEFAGGADNRTVPRFGNWVRVATGHKTWSVFHLDEIDPAIRSGATVEVGQVLGYAGRTGLDFTSAGSGGRVKTLHFHSEVSDGTSYAHDSDDSLNPGARRAGHYPREDSDDIAEITWQVADDPNADSCTQVTITLDRNADGTMPALDRVSFAGSLDSHEIAYEARTGIDPADPDNPDYEGVYQVPHPFNSASSQYVIDYFHEIATYGDRRSVIAYDTEDAILAAFPFARTAAGLFAIVGATPTNIYLHDQAAGSSVCLLTGTELAPQGTPTLNVTTDFGNGDKAVQMADGTAQRLEAAASATFDDGMTSFAWLSFRLFGTAPASTRNWQFKGAGSIFSAGRFLVTGGLEYAVNDGSGSRSATIAADHASAWHAMIHGVDRTNNLIHLHSDLGDATASAAGLGTLASAGLFAEGRSSIGAAQTLTYSARFVGAEAETLLTNAAAAIAAIHVPF